MQAEHRRPMLAFLAVMCLAMLIVGQALGQTERVVRELVTPATAAAGGSATVVLADRLSERPRPAAPRGDAPTPGDVAVDLGVPDTFVTTGRLGGSDVTTAGTTTDVATGGTTTGVTTADLVVRSSSTDTGREAAVRTAAARTPARPAATTATTAPVLVARPAVPEVAAGAVVTAPGQGNGTAVPSPVTPGRAKDAEAGKGGKAGKGDARRAGASRVKAVKGKARSAEVSTGRASDPVVQRGAVRRSTAVTVAPSPSSAPAPARAGRGRSGHVDVSRPDRAAEPARASKPARSAKPARHATAPKHTKAVKVVKAAKPGKGSPGSHGRGR